MGRHRLSAALAASLLLLAAGCDDAGSPKETSAAADTAVVARINDGDTLTLRGGAMHSRSLAAMPGSPAMPLTPAQLEAKFRSCVARSARPVSADHILRCIEQLESCDNVRELRLYA